MVILKYLNTIVNMMNLSEFLRIMFTVMFQKNILSQMKMLINVDEYNEKSIPFQTVNSAVENLFFDLPTIHCKDGFSFKIDISTENYSTENGFRKFGYQFDTVTLSECSIDEKLIDTHKSHDGTIKMAIVDAIVFKHGGIDWSKTAGIKNIEFLVV